MTNAAGAVGQTYDYAAFGDLLQAIPDPVSDYLYTGQRYDATTEQYYLRAREYDPVVGRFLSRDTWAVDTWNPIELNRYVYAAANPIIYSDPSGHGILEYKLKLANLGAGSAVASEFWGSKLEYLYVRVQLSVVQWMPWLDHAACLFAEVLTDADFQGSGCDVLPNLPIGYSKKLVKIIQRIGGDHWGAGAIQDAKTAMRNVKIPGYTAEELEEVFTDSNWMLTQVSVDGSRLKPIWAISGMSSGKVKAVEDALRESGLKVNSMEGKVNDLLGDKKPIRQIFGAYFGRVWDTENKTLVPLAQELEELDLKAGQNIFVQIVTVKKPCKLSCGGSTGVDGVIGEFGEWFYQKGINVEIRVNYLEQ